MRPGPWIKRNPSGEIVADLAEPPCVVAGQQSFRQVAGAAPESRGEAREDRPEGWPEGRHPCWYWRSDADGTAIWGPTSRPVPQWTRPGATPVQALGRHD